MFQMAIKFLVSVVDFDTKMEVQEESVVVAEMKHYVRAVLHGLRMAVTDRLAREA